MFERTRIPHVQNDLVSDASRLLDLGGLAVDRVASDAFGGRVVHLVTADETASACPSCGVLSTTATVTYAGSESGEKATGPTELRLLLSDLLGRPMSYSFEFGEITFSEHNEMVWLPADGYGTQTGDDGATETFPYRLTGVLANESAQWRWRLLAGSEPTPGLAPSQALNPEVLLGVGAGVLGPVDVHQTQGIRHDVSACLREHHVCPGLHSAMLPVITIDREAGARTVAPIRWWVRIQGSMDSPSAPVQVA